MTEITSIVNAARPPVDKVSAEFLNSINEQFKDVAELESDIILKNLAILNELKKLSPPNAKSTGVKDYNKLDELNAERQELLQKIKDLTDLKPAL